MEDNQNNLGKIIEHGVLIKKINSNVQGIHSEAYLYNWLGDYYVIRQIGRQYNISPRQLVVLEKNLHTYYKLLKKSLDMNLPGTFFSGIDKKQNIILLVTEYFSKGNITEVKSVSKRIECFKTISRSLIKLASVKNNLYLDNTLICSIDVNPNNFLLSSDNSIVYNDFTPPFYREKRKWLEFRRRDEIHAKKSEKVKRYFTGLNLLLSFVNKTRIHLSFADYLNFIEWLSNEVHKSNLQPQNSITIFSQIYEELSNDKILNFQKFEECITLRDILRFALTFRRDLTRYQVKNIYEESKKPNGINILIKEVV